MKLLIIITTFLLFVSCKMTNSTIDGDSKIPIEVVNLKQCERYDTLLTITLKNEMYIFNKKGNYIGSMKLSSDEIIYRILSFISLITLLFYCLSNMVKKEETV